MGLVNYLAALAAMTPAAANAVGMGPDAIQAVFGNSRPFIANFGSQTYSIVLSSDGTASRTLAGTKLAQDGSWRLTSSGFCWKWATDTKESCYTINVTVAANELVREINETLVVAGAGTCTDNSGGLVISSEAGSPNCKPDPDAEWVGNDQVNAGFDVDDTATHVLVGHLHTN